MLGQAQIKIASPKRHTYGILCTRSLLKIVILILNLKSFCCSSTCAKCVRGVHFYYGFIMILDVKLFGGIRATRDRFCVCFSGISNTYLLYGGQNRNVAKIGRVIFYVFAGVEIMMVFCDPGAFWAVWGGLLVASCSWLVWGLLFTILAGILIMTIFYYRLYVKMLQNSFWRPRGLLGLLGLSL